MTDRQIALLIDGGFFLKRIEKLVPEERRATPADVVDVFRRLCRTHVKMLTGDEGDRWHRYVYRIFFYDAAPYAGVAHHPTENRQIDFSKSDLAKFRSELFELLKRQRNVAVRMGKINKEGDWAITGAASRKIIATKAWIEALDFAAIGADGVLTLTEAQKAEALRLQRIWTAIETWHIKLPLRQKGVDMRIGLDIASLTLKKQVQTIILVAGDSDFVPAAKLARREGVQFILDPLWQSVNDDLFEHIDGLQSGLPKPRAAEAPPAAEAMGAES